MCRETRFAALKGEFNNETVDNHGLSGVAAARGRRTQQLTCGFDPKERRLSRDCRCARQPTTFLSLHIRRCNHELEQYGSSRPVFLAPGERRVMSMKAICHALKPPSIVSMAPVTNAASGLAKYATIPAISSTCAKRRTANMGKNVVA